MRDVAARAAVPAAPAPDRIDSDGNSGHGTPRLTVPHATGALVPGRSCGSCTACCRILEIKALAKPAGILCRHNSGRDCGIYPERPEACVQWHCLWRRIAALPDALRPDRAGVVFALERRNPGASPGKRPGADAPEGACIVGRALDGADAFERWEAVEAFAMFVREGSLPVWKAHDRHATLLYRGPAVAHSSEDET
ncbi:MULTISPECIES: hypothetical protein [unclassified Methylobacterium]|uniref:hypothetical protein n=1 Tax=unclassified Methylobacterium TaxID=2615210 RepID=UPI001FEEBE4E|nr:hypothetical protein [Methylobacterium sp. WL64]